MFSPCTPFIGIRLDRYMTEENKKPVSKLKLSRAEIKEALETIPPERLLGINSRESTITHKQKIFIKEVAMGEKKTKAYRKAFNSKGNNNTVGSEASKLAKVPKIAQEIEAYKLALEAREYLTGDRLTALVLHQLTQHALNDEVPPATRVRSLELLGKSNGVNLFTETKETTVIHKSEKAKETLLKTIQDAMKRNAMEVEYKDSAESLLDELRNTPAPSENFIDETATPPTTLNEPLHGQPDMHNNLHTQSQKNEVATLPDDTNDINIEAQVIDSKGDTPVDFVANPTIPNIEKPPVTVLNEKGEKNI